MSAGQRAYESKRAARAGMTLDRWIGDKDRARTETAVPKPAKPRGRIAAAIGRLIDRAHKPL